MEHDSGVVIFMCVMLFESCIINRVMRLVNLEIVLLTYIYLDLKFLQIFSNYYLAFKTRFFTVI